MKAIFKRAASFLLTAVLIVSLVSGCGSGGEDKKAAKDTGKKSTAAEPSEKESFNKEGLPITKDPVTLTVLTTRWGSMGDSFTQNQWLKDLEKESNVQPKWQVQSLNDWGEQKSILLASHELPDVILGSETFNDADIINNTDLFLDLTDLMDQYMPNLKAAMKIVPTFETIVTFPDGKIYSLPKNLPSRPQTRNQPIINKKWLDNLNLKEPSTIEELTDVLRAFKTKDANGNGDPDDEFPICGAKGLPMDLLNPFGITDLSGTNMMVQEDGSLVYYPTADNYKEGIKWLNTLFQEGIIDPESFTQDETMQNGKRQNEAASLVGFDYQWTPDAVFGKWSPEYIALPPIKGSDGKQYEEGDPNGVYSIMRNEAEITASCKTPEIAARWLDQFYDGEASIQNFWGAIGTVINKNDDGTYTLNDPPEGTSADAWYWDQSLRDFGPKYVSPEFQDKIKLSPESGDGLKVELSKLGDPFITTPYPSVMFTAEETEALATYRTDIDKFVATTRAEWITKGGIDKGWDDYVKQLEDMGLKDMIKIYEDAYDRYQEVSK